MTPCSSSSWRIHPDVLIQQCVVERYRHVMDATQSAFPTSAQCGCEAQHQSYTMHCRSPRKAVRSCFPCYLHGHQSGSHKDGSVQGFACSRLTIGLELSSQLLGASALVHTLRTFASSHVLSRDLLAQASGCSNLPLRCP